MGAGEEFGFQLSRLFTYVNPDGMESDYVQAVLNASSLKTAKEKIILFMHVASRGKPARLTSVRRSPAFRIVAQSAP